MAKHDFDHPYPKSLLERHKAYCDGYDIYGADAVSELMAIIEEDHADSPFKAQIVKGFMKRVETELTAKLNHRRLP